MHDANVQYCWKRRFDQSMKQACSMLLIVQYHPKYGVGPAAHFVEVCGANMSMRLTCGYDRHHLFWR